MQATRAKSDRLYRKIRNADPKLAAAERIRNGMPWRRFAKVFKANHPLCCNPFGLHTLVGVKDVHHVQSLIDRPELAYDEENCRSLCRSCHNRVEAMERNGKRTKGLFDGCR